MALSTHLGVSKEEILKGKGPHVWDDRAEARNASLGIQEESKRLQNESRAQATNLSERGLPEAA